MPYKKLPVKSIKCKDCRTPFMQKVSTQVYCSDICRKSAETKHRRSLGSVAKLGIPTGATGAASELIVCADLLKKGVHVFRAQSPACPCDLIAMNGPVILRIEVRTGIMGTRGKLNFPLHRRDEGRSDIVSVVTHDWEIYYLNHQLEEVDIDKILLLR